MSRLKRPTWAQVLAEPYRLPHPYSPKESIIVTPAGDGHTVTCGMHGEQVPAPSVYRAALLGDNPEEFCSGCRRSQYGEE